MQTLLDLDDFWALCVDGPLQGRCYAQPDHERPQALGPGEIPYRPVQTERGEWIFMYAEDLDQYPE